MNFKVEKISNFTTIDNGIFQDRRLTNSARGLLVLMLSLPNDWDFSVKGLVAICREGERAVKSALRELKELGYLKVNKLLPNETTSHTIEYEYIIYEKAQDLGCQDIHNQEVHNQEVQNSPLDTDPLNNNNKPPLYNKILNNKKEIYKETDTYTHPLEDIIAPEDKFTEQEIADYITLKGYNIKAKEFYNYYKAKGWKLGNTIITDIRPVIDNWGFKRMVENRNNDINKQQAPIRQREYEGYKFGSIEVSDDEI